MKVVQFFSILIFLSGCAKAFLPPPYAYEQWKRANTTIIETKKIMIACGYSSASHAGGETDFNKIALQQLCMEKNGFKYTSNVGTFCKSYPDLPACVAAAEEKWKARALK